ncbi:hypothetical protein [Caldivirga maquilingensis]|uniref:Uncharacterized protein n=1 Tax=Caldivirga maquilingensis (strain ATCC 700844 / DSM 13496 / JCM 10307 / IC-167) TaxID=397948 RepID=A8MAG2_CALMQ|nr:hypothetical protein [Caldivirga maquilingensis]ABW02539.1 hypothetical protein Cmaq_1716 [Caldivirga maquilingensis IC-167]
MVAFIESTVKDYVKLLDDRISKLRELSSRLSDKVSNANVNNTRLSILRFENSEVFIVNGSDNEQLMNALMLILKIVNFQEKLYTLVKNDLSKLSNDDVKIAVIEPLGLPTRIILVPNNAAPGS